MRSARLPNSTRPTVPASIATNTKLAADAGERPGIRKVRGFPGAREEPPMHRQQRIAPMLRSATEQLGRKTPAYLPCCSSATDGDLDIYLA